MATRHLTPQECAEILDDALGRESIQAARAHLEACAGCWETWNAVRWLRAEDTVDLAELRDFLGADMIEGIDSSWKLANEWREASPRTEEEVLAFYQRTEWYLYNLIIWHASGQRPRYASQGLEVLRRFGCRSICDYGCGVGTDGLAFARHGYEVSFVDVNRRLLDFVAYRLQRRGLTGRTGTPEELRDHVEAWDALWAMDVLEHLQHPIQTLGPVLSKCSVLIFDTEHAGSSGGRHPFHFDHSPDIVSEQLASIGFRSVGEVADLNVWVADPR